MEKESSAVYQNDNKEFDEEVESYRKEKKSNTRKIKILSSIFVVILFIILINPFKTLKSIEKPELEERWVDGEEVSCLKGSDTPYTGNQITYLNGQKKEEANFKDGKRDGFQTHWYENGQKQIEANSKDGEPHGPALQWHDNGQKLSEGNFKNGKPDGLLVNWYENGQKQGETNFKDGKKEGLFTSWHDNGQKRGEVTFKNGEPDGLSMGWNKNGEREFVETYKDGKPDGLSVGWHKHGQKKWEVKFKDSEKISANYWNSKGEPFDSLEEALK